MGNTRVLVIEDEPAMADIVARYLRRDGHTVDVASDGLEGLRLYREERPDLVVLDLMLPGVDGFEVCRRIRSIAETPIIMVTARGEEMDRLLGFGMGADDYVAKPFSPRELAARVQAVLRRTQSATQSTRDELRFGDFRIDSLRRTVETVTGDIALTAREFDILFLMASHPGQVFTREQLLDSVWGRDAVAEPNAVTVHVRRIRQKLEPDPSRPGYIKTVWGVGYKFEPA